MAKKTKKKVKKKPTDINALIRQVIKAAMEEILQRARSNIRGGKEKDALF